MVLSFSNYFTVGVLCGYLFGVDNSDGKGGVVPRTTHLTSHKLYFCNDDCGNFVS